MTAKMLTALQESWMRRALTMSPLQQINIRKGICNQSVYLKLEMCNPTGSVKYRTALSLLQELDRDRPLGYGTTIVESTSGNLGLALAQLSAEIGCHYVAVVDPKLPPATREAMAAAGADIVTVKDRDEHGGYLLSRLRMINELCDSPSMRWANQYEGMGNPAVHRDVTGPELVAQTYGQLDMVVVAVGTGGTLAGISEYIHRASLSPRILAVDVAGSLATSSELGRPHLLIGIGASRKSSFLRPHHYDRVAHVLDIEALAACRLLEQDTGLALGGSSGAVLTAFLADLSHHPTPPRLPVLFCPDGGFKYRNTIYNDSWLSSQGALDAVNDAVTDARRDGLRFDLGEIKSHVPI